WAATSPQLAGMGGVYCEDCDIAEPAAEGTVLGSGVSAWAADPDRAARLWKLSAELTGVDAFTP
ncbi:oxidoreductase, partial [Streptomyces sp. NPDC058418]